MKTVLQQLGMDWQSLAVIPDRNATILCKIHSDNGVLAVFAQFDNGEWRTLNDDGKPEHVLYGVISWTYVDTQLLNITRSS